MSNEVIKAYGGFCIYCGAPGITDEHWLPKWLGGFMYIEDATCAACQSRINDTIENPLSQGPFNSARKYIGFKSNKKKKSNGEVELMSFTFGRKGKADWDALVPIDENPGFFGLVCFDEPLIYSFRKAKRKRKQFKPTELRIVSSTLSPSKHQAFMRKYPSDTVVSPLFHFETFRRFLAKVALGAASHFYGANFRPLIGDFILNGGGDVGEFYVGSTTERCPPKPEAMPHWISGDWITIRGKEYLEVEIQLFCHLEVPIYKVIVGEKIDTTDINELAAAWRVEPGYFAEVLAKRGALADKRSGKKSGNGRPRDVSIEGAVMPSKPDRTLEADIVASSISEEPIG